MKISGKVGKLTEMIEKMSCGGVFEPVTMKLMNDVILGRKFRDNSAIGISKFNSLDVEDVGDGMFLTINGSDFLDNISPISSVSDFTMLIEGGNIVFKSPKETVYYRLDEGYDDPENYADELPFKIDGDKVIFGNTELTSCFKLESSELREAVKRRNIVDVDYFTISGKGENEGELKFTIGDLSSSEYNPRKYIADAECIQGGDDETKIAFGLDRISSVLSGNIELYYSQSYPVVILDSGDDYRAVYAIGPVEEA